MKKSILIMVALFTIGFMLQSCGKSSEKKENETSESQTTKSDTMNMNKMNNKMMHSMNSMMTKMKDMKMTRDFDLDFATMMIMHHQAAIDMSEVEVAKGNDTQIKTMAQNIITTQKAEIEQIQQFVKKYKMPKAKMENGKMHDELAETMKIMMDEMMNMQMSNNLDKDFVMMMIRHHEGAVTMAKDEIAHGKQSELKTMAQKMITDQTKEIKDFNAWLASQK